MLGLSRTGSEPPGRRAYLVGMDDHSIPVDGSASPSGLEPLLSIAELARYLGVPVATIYDWRVEGKGPRGIRIGRHVKFTVCDVRA